MNLNKLLLFVFPAITVLLGVSSNAPGWGDLVAALYLTIAGMAFLLCLGFLLINRWLQWELNWWKSLVISAALTAVALGVLVLVARV